MDGRNTSGHDVVVVPRAISDRAATRIVLPLHSFATGVFVTLNDCSAYEARHETSVYFDILWHGRPAGGVVGVAFTTGIGAIREFAEQRRF